MRNAGEALVKLALNSQELQKKTLALNSQELQKNNEAKSYSDEALELIDTLLKENKDDLAENEKNQLEILQADCRRTFQ